VRCVARLTSTQAAQRLGIKPATLYAYVSRGIVASQPSSDGRTSTFSASDIEQLARHGRPRQASRPRALDFTVDTAITRIAQTSLHFRGYNAVSLATTHTFEQVAELLLSGRMQSHRQWLPSEVAVLDSNGEDMFTHVAMASLIAGHANPFRSDLDPAAVADAARTLIATIVDSLPIIGDGRTPRLVIGDHTFRSTIAGRMWTRWSPRRPASGMINLINAALVLLCDHELAVSTVAARVAASTRADPYAVIGAGIAAISGPLHGRASRAARTMLDDAMVATSVDVAVSAALGRDGHYPGFGHAVYKGGDPRAELLLSMLRTHAGGTTAMSRVDAVITSIKRRKDIEPNVDLALAAIGLVADLPSRSAELIFSTARVAGWTAHAIEEYGEAPLRFRARALYTGPAPRRL
jgi:citrate synthase